MSGPDSDNQTDKEHDVFDNLARGALAPTPALLDRDTEVDDRKLLGQRQDCSEGERPDAHADRGEDGCGEVAWDGRESSEQDDHEPAFAHYVCHAPVADVLAFVAFCMFL